MALLSSINKLIDNKVDFITAGMILIFASESLWFRNSLRKGQIIRSAIICHFL